MTQLGPSMPSIWHEDGKRRSPAMTTKQARRFAKMLNKCGIVLDGERYIWAQSIEGKA